MIRYYTGVGSRNTPQTTLHLMENISSYFNKRKYILRSGGAQGADKAFELGAGYLKEIYYASDANEEAEKIAKKFHPKWNILSEYAKKLHARNAFQVLGKDLNHPSEFVICWTADGCESHKERSIKTGGTGTAISIADKYNVKIINLYHQYNVDFFINMLEKTKD